MNPIHNEVGKKGCYINSTYPVVISPEKERVCAIG